MHWYYQGFELRSKVRIGAGLCRGGVEAISGLIDNPHHTLLVLLLLYILAFDIFLPPNSVSCTRTEVAPPLNCPASKKGNYAKLLSSKLLGLSVV